jgi:hypothetical protein
MLKSTNYHLINNERTVFAIKDIRKNTSKKIFIDCDSLQGASFILYYNNLETEGGFILSDSIILNKTYLPAKITKAEALSLSTVVVEFSKNILDTGNYVIKNSQGITFDILNKSLNNKQITLTLSKALS